MKKYWHITWMLVVMLFTLAACSDDDENEIVIDEAWKEINLFAGCKDRYVFVHDQF